MGSGNKGGSIRVLFFHWIRGLCPDAEKRILTEAEKESQRL